MKINQLIRDLEEAREWCGEDAEVFIKESNGRINNRIGVGADQRVMIEGEGEGVVCVITSYIRF